MSKKKTTKTAKVPTAPKAAVTAAATAAPAPRKDDGRIQIVGRLPKDLSTSVRGTAKRLGVTLNAFMCDAFTVAVLAAKDAKPAKAAKAADTKA